MGCYASWVAIFEGDYARDARQAHCIELRE